MYINTDESWKVGKGPLVFNNLYLGERFDARLLQNNWTLGSFDDSKWTAAIIDNNKKGNLVQSEIPKIRKKKILTPAPYKRKSQRKFNY